MKYNAQPVVASQTEFRTSLIEAKAWIGRQLVLRKPWLGYNAGTACKVMCVVDFGDGLLLWIITDDEYSKDVDQVEIKFMNQLFSPWHSH